jgi:phenylpropionate dioxygenase-like ring-hydroxylating dioxygenase large terminal subunit
MQATPRAIPAARYTAKGWHDLECERMWNRVWQIACTEDCIPDTGDHWVYEIANLSVLIVRGEDGELRGFKNSCPHRGNLLCTQEGRGLEEIRCAYHHWRFDLEGRLTSMSPQGEAATRPSADPGGPLPNGIGLTSVSVGTWAGFVFVNPDLDCEPLEDYLESLPEELAWVRMQDYSCDSFMTVALDCNWKTCLDAFIETYHLHAVHPQMLAIADDVNTPITLYDKHTKFMQPYGVASPRRHEGVGDQEIWEAFVQNLGHRMGIPFAEAGTPGPAPAVPEGQTIRDVLVGRIRAHLGNLGPLYEDLDDHHVIDDFHYHVFPNAVFNVFAGWYGLIRARPGATPDSCFLDMWNFDLRRSESPENHPRPEHKTLAPEELPALGPVMMQDLELLPRVQKGLRQKGTEPIRLTPAESRIGRMHQILERYLDPPLEWQLEKPNEGGEV